MCPADIQESYDKLSDENKQKACSVARSLLEGWLIDQNKQELKQNREKKTPELHLVIIRSDKSCLNCDGPMDEVKYTDGLFNICRKGCNEHDLLQIIKNRQLAYER